jgi:hypothetical protein
MGQYWDGPLTSAQIRAARALIRWSAEDLAERSKVSLRTIRRAELSEGQTALTEANDLAIRRALEAAGVEFTNGGQPGVRISPAGTEGTSSSMPVGSTSDVTRKSKRQSKGRL